jgi:flavin reductase (DIM6/NTAB) family NADH-FMN oxidoreductase RutF
MRKYKKHNIFNLIPSYIYVLTTRYRRRDNGCIIDSIMLSNSVPRKITISVSKRTLSCENIKATGKFNLIGLGIHTPITLIKKLGFHTGYKKDKFEKADRKEYFRSKNDLLVYPKTGTLYLSCDVTDIDEDVDHYVFQAVIVEASELKPAEPLTYTYYLKNMKEQILDTFPVE